MKKRVTFYCLLILFLAGTFIKTDNAVILIMDLAMVVLPILSFVLLKVLSKKITFSFECNDNVIRGNKETVQIRMKSKLPFLFGKCTANLVCYNLTLNTKSIQKLVFNTSSESYVYEYKFSTKNCGKLCIRLENISILDILDFFTTEINFNQEKFISIVPHIFNGIYVNKNPNFMEQSIDNKDDSKGKILDYSSIDQIREYKSGDSFSRIHWKLTSKYDEYIVKDFEKVSNYFPLVILNSAPNSLEKFEEINNCLYDIYASIVLSLTNAIAMTGTCILNENSLEINSVNGEDEGIQDIYRCISTPIANKIIDSSKYYDELNTFTFSKVIIISYQIEEELIIRLKEKRSITSLVLGDSLMEVQNEGTTILSINRKEIEDSLKHIEI